MNKLWSDRAWDDYLYWQGQDRRTLRKINDLVKDIERNGAAQDWQARTAAIPGWLEPPNRRKPVGLRYRHERQSAHCCLPWSL